jgi:hypothetical protein
VSRHCRCSSRRYSTSEFTRTGSTKSAWQAGYRITAREAARFTGNLADAAHLVEPVILKPVVVSDPADDPVLYTAADGAADVLCTRNTRHFSSPAVQAFCDEHAIRVMTDLDILRELFSDGGSGGQA